MAKRYRPKSTPAIITEMTSGSDRVRAVVGGSFVDGALDHVITKRLIALEPPEESVLYKVGGPMGTCNQKILMGYALGLFGSKAKADLERINEIRNIFAHNMNDVSFGDKDVADLCSKLTSGISEADKSKPLKDRFVISIFHLIMALAQDADENTATKLKRIKGRLSD